MTHDEILIVGGGLAGLSLARLLHRDGRSFALVEAREQLGGRIATHELDGASFDLGPAWYWPGQPRIAKLIDDLGLRSFEQFSDGAAVYEDEQQRRQTAQGFASMAGAFRLSGGFGGLVAALEKELPTDRIFMDHPCRDLTYEDNSFTATVGNKVFNATKVVLAIPPRVAAELIDFKPPLASTVMSEIPTWMAGHAKAVAIYDTPFWRGSALSGDAASRSGPMMEVHDASPQPENLGALFGFLGVSVEQRKDEQALRLAILDQLGRLFGPQAGRPKALVIKDWAFDPYTSTTLDHPPLYAHPKYGMPAALTNLCDGRLIFGSTETAPEFGGYLEGALEAAEITFETLCRVL